MQAGEARVRLIKISSNSTELDYEVNAEIAGKLAQIGGRLISGVAKKMSAQFFENFTNALNETEPVD